MKEFTIAVFGIAAGIAIAAAFNFAATPAPCVDSAYRLGGTFGASQFSCAPGAVASVEGEIGKCTCIRSWAEVGESAP